MNATDPQNAAGGPPSDFEHAPATVTLPGSADAATGQPDPATAELEARLARLAARPIPPTPEAPPEVQAAEKVQANYARAVKITEAGLPLEACRAAVQLAKRPAAPGTREAQWLDRLQQAREIVADREHGRLLLLLGSVGTGKSSLAYVLGVEALAEHRTVRYLTWQDLALEFEAAKAASEDPRTEARFRTRHALTQHLIRLDLLILDEADKGVDTTATMRLILNVFTHREAHRRPTVILSNFSDKELGAFLGPALTDRANANTAALNMAWASFRRRQA